MDDRRQRIQDWFDDPEPDFPIRESVVGLVLIIIGVLLSGAARALCVLGALGFLAVKLRLYWGERTRYDNRPSTAQMLQWLDEDFIAVKDASLSRFERGRSDLTSESQVIAEPRWSDTPDPGGDQEGRRRAVDGESEAYLYSGWTISVIHFTAGHILNYQCHYDWYGGLPPCKESTNVIPYQHVVSVQTQGPSPVAEVVLSLTTGQSVRMRFGAAELAPVNHQELKAKADAAIRAIHAAKWNLAEAPMRVSLGAATAGPEPLPMEGRSKPNFCPKCGCQFQPEDLFCPDCGSRR